MIKIQTGDIFDSTADALIVQCDGASRKSVGKIGLAMQKRMGEDEWDYVMDQFQWPIALGTVQHCTLEGENFQRLILMSCLSHQEGDHLAILRTALARAFAVAAGQGCRTVAMVLGRGGWRLRLSDAARATLNAARTQPKLDLTVFTLDEDAAIVIQQLLP